MTAKKLYESKDSSINISAEVDWLRWLLGVAFTDTAGPAARMRMIVIHLGPLCLAFASFTVRKRPKPR